MAQIVYPTFQSLKPLGTALYRTTIDNDTKPTLDWTFYVTIPTLELTVKIRQGGK